jgi:hypothetical protein
MAKRELLSNMTNAYMAGKNSSDCGRENGNADSPLGREGCHGTFSFTSCTL